MELRSVQFVSTNRISVHIQLLPAFSLAPTAAAGALDAASAGGKVEKKHLKLAVLGSVQLCAFLGVKRDRMRITLDPGILLVFLDAFKGLAVGSSAGGVRAEC